MKEARDELAQGKGNYKTKPENERERKKNVKEERKIRNRSSWTLSSITKTKIGGSREIRSRVEKEKLERGNEQDRRYSRKCTRARISEWRKEFRRHRKGRKKERKKTARDRGEWRGIRSGILTRPGTFVAKTVDSRASVCSHPIKTRTFFSVPPYVSHACTCSFKYVWGTEREDHLRAIASPVAI